MPENRMGDNGNIVLTKKEADELTELKQKLKLKGIFITHLDGKKKPIIFENFGTYFSLTYSFSSSNRKARIEISLEEESELLFRIVSIK